MNYIKLEPIKLISQTCKCCGVTYSREITKEDYGICDRCLFKTIVELYKEENKDLTIEEFKEKIKS